MANQGKPQGQQNRNTGGGYGNQQRAQGGGDRPSKKEKKDESALRDEYKKIWNDNLFPEILREEKQDYNNFIDTIKKYIEPKKDTVSASQLRNIYTEVIKLKKDEVQKLYAIRPKLAYAAGRAEKDDVKEIMLLMDDLIKEVKSESQLVAFQKFFEAIIAYHKFYGGKQ
jgi:CRISPR type III-A-associated protein Csm2